MMSDVSGWTIDELAAAYRDGATVSDVIERVLDLLAALPRGVLIGEPLRDLARADAARIDALPADARGRLALLGIPVVVKDNIDVAGAPTTVACPGASRIATEDAAVVARLRAAGAIVVAKTNLDQFATGLVGTRSPYGTPPNTIDPALVPGGSSSGSAIAVALGAVPVALGTDTAGSGRVPASLNGVVALKPTLGSVSTAGIVPAVRRADCPSIFARTTADARRVLEAIAGPDERDAYSRARPQVRPLRWPPTIGVPDPWPSEVPTDPRVREWFDDAVARLRVLGCSVVGVDVSDLLALGELLYGSALVAERTAAVGALVDAHVEGLDPTVGSIIGAGSRWSAVDAYRGEYALAELRARAARTWEAVDVLALPTTPTLPTLEDVGADPIGANRAVGRFTTFANLADLAAAVVPMADGIPAGLQLVAPAWHDGELLQLGESYLRGELLPPLDATTIVVVGAHLEGLPLNGQLTELGAWLRARTTTSPRYRLYALAGTVPPKPGLRRAAVDEDGAAIAVEVWSIGTAEMGSFLRNVPAPLCIGTVELVDGSTHHGFLCEPWALEGAEDITAFGGWRAYLASR